MKKSEKIAFIFYGIALVLAFYMMIIGSSIYSRNYEFGLSIMVAGTTLILAVAGLMSNAWESRNLAGKIEKLSMSIQTLERKIDKLAENFQDHLVKLKRK